MSNFRWNMLKEVKEVRLLSLACMLDFVCLWMSTPMFNFYLLYSFAEPAFSEKSSGHGCSGISLYREDIVCANPARNFRPINFILWFVWCVWHDCFRGEGIQFFFFFWEFSRRFCAQLLLQLISCRYLELFTYISLDLCIGVCSLCAQLLLLFSDWFETFGHVWI